MSPIDADDTLHVEKPVGFEQVPAALYDNTDISDGAVRLYIILSSYGGREDKAIPNKRTLANRLGKGISAVDDRLKQLRQYGWLLVTPRWKGNDKGGQGSNHYQLLWTPLRDVNDVRLRRHKAAVARFEKQMAAAKEANRLEREAAKREAAKREADPTRKTGGGEPAQTPPGKPGAPHPENRVGPTRKTGPLYPDLLEPQPVLTDNGRGAVAPTPGKVIDLFGQEETPPEPPIGNQATAAFVEGWTSTRQRPPLQKHRDTIGLAAKRMLRDGATRQEVLTAARRCGEGGFLDMDRQWRSDQGSQRAGNGRSSTADKIAQQDDIGRQIRQMMANGGNA